MTSEQITATLKRVSKCMMELGDQGQKEKYPVSLLRMDCWEWPQGVGLLGLAKYAIAQKDQNVLDFLVQWYDDHMEQAADPSKLERNVNSTAPMIALTYLYEYYPKPEYMELIRSWADWVMDPNGLIRTGDGCMQHMITGDPNKDQLLIDTLYMTVLFLLRAGTILGRQDMIDEANYQVLAHIKYLFDTHTGMFFHGWTFDGMHNYGQVHWLRGNSWYTLGAMDIIFEQEKLPEALRRMYIQTLSRQAQAIKSYQDPAEGLWHTVIDEPTSYIEVSGSAAYLCGIMKAVRKGLLDESEYIDMIRLGISNIFRYVGVDGAVKNVSYGTPIGADQQFYMDIPCFIMTYGQALMILLLHECMNEYWMRRL